MINKKKILIIGGSAAGPAAAAKCKRVEPSNEVVMYEKGNYISIGSCEIPYVLSGIISDYQKIIFFNPEQFYEEKKVLVKTNHVVRFIDRRKKLIHVTDTIKNLSSEVHYDKLILCTGSTSKKLPIFNSDLVNVCYVKTINDLLKIIDYVKNNPIKNISIIGAGFIGLELVDFAKSINAQLTFIEKDNLPLFGFDNEIRKIMLKEIEAQNISFFGNVDSISPTIKDNKVISLKVNKENIESDLIIVAIGFRPNNDLAISSQIDTLKNGAIKTNQYLTTSDDNIFAAGDCTHVIDFQTNKPRYLPLANIAHKQGHIAGNNACYNKKQMDKIVKNICLKLLGFSLSAVGISTDELNNDNVLYDEILVEGLSRIKIMPNPKKHLVKILIDKNKNILGANLIGDEDIVGRANLISFAIKNRISLEKFLNIDFSYTPQLTPFIETLQIAANKIRK